MRYINSRFTYLLTYLKNLPQARATVVRTFPASLAQLSRACVIGLSADQRKEFYGYRYYKVSSAQTQVSTASESILK